MTEVFWIIGLIFFTTMTICNAQAYRKNKTSLLPTIFSFLFTLITLLLFLEQPLLYISLLILTLFLLSVVKYPEISKIQEKRNLDELEKTDINEPLKIKDLILGMKFWGKISVRWGAKKAAFTYSLSISIIVGLGLMTMSILIPELEIRGFFVLEMIIIFTAGIYYQMHRTFGKYLDKMIAND